MSSTWPPLPAGLDLDASDGPGPSRTFGDAIITCLSKYAHVSGRASRSEYWFWALAVVIASAAAEVVDRVVEFGFVSIFVVAVTALPSVSVTVRRLHDTGRSGWWLLLAAVPYLGGLVLVVLLALEGDRGPNRYA